MRVALFIAEPTLKLLMTRGLLEEGISVRQSQSVTRSVSDGDLLECDAVVLDWPSSWKSSLDAIETWRALGLRLPVVVLVSRCASSAELAPPITGIRFLTKPFDFEVLLAALRAPPGF